mmetsp:Transcript_9296/g.27583  ORF Transcript_9296/g.27583 Transcript_9296/m.27583 type:complete len:251 (-) Transcript_9296:74-826(-)
MWSCPASPSSPWRASTCAATDSSSLCLWASASVLRSSPTSRTAAASRPLAVATSTTTSASSLAATFARSSPRWRWRQPRPSASSRARTTAMTSLSAAGRRRPARMSVAISPSGRRNSKRTRTASGRTASAASCTMTRPRCGATRSSLSCARPIASEPFSPCSSTPSFPTRKRRTPRSLTRRAPPRSRQDPSETQRSGYYSVVTSKQRPRTLSYLVRLPFAAACRGAACECLIRDRNNEHRIPRRSCLVCG